MSTSYALDANIVIKLLRNDKTVERNFDRSFLNGDKIVIPKAVDYEIRRGFSIIAAPKKELTYNKLVEQCFVVEICAAAWDRSVYIYESLYRKGYTVGEIDILIAAFCLVNDCTLITNNIADFINIDGLHIVDWTAEEPKGEFP